MHEVGSLVTVPGGKMLQQVHTITLDYEQLQKMGRFQAPGRNQVEPAMANGEVA